MRTCGRKPISASPGSRCSGRRGCRPTACPSGRNACTLRGAGGRGARKLALLREAQAQARTHEALEEVGFMQLAAPLGLTDTERRRGIMRTTHGTVAILPRRRSPGVRERPAPAEEELIEARKLRYERARTSAAVELAPVDCGRHRVMEGERAFAGGAKLRRGEGSSCLAGRRAQLAESLGHGGHGARRGAALRRTARCISRCEGGGCRRSTGRSGRSSRTGKAPARLRAPERPLVILNRR